MYATKNITSPYQAQVLCPLRWQDHVSSRIFIWHTGPVHTLKIQPSWFQKSSVFELHDHFLWWLSWTLFAKSRWWNLSLHRVRLSWSLKFRASKKNMVRMERACFRGLWDSLSGFWRTYSTLFSWSDNHRIGSILSVREFFPMPCH